MYLFHNSTIIIHKSVNPLARVKNCNIIWLNLIICNTSHNKKNTTYIYAYCFNLIIKHIIHIVMLCLILFCSCIKQKKRLPFEAVFFVFESLIEFGFCRLVWIFFTCLFLFITHWSKLQCRHLLFKRRWSSGTFWYRYLVMTSPQSLVLP